MDKSKLAEFKTLLGLKIIRWDAECNLFMKEAEDILKSSTFGLPDMDTYRRLCESTAKAKTLYEISSELKDLMVDYFSNEDDPIYKKWKEEKEAGDS